MNSDFKDLLRCLNDAGADYLVVGGYAVMEHTEPRYTKDLDIWVRTDIPNAHRVYQALAAFGAPTDQFAESDLQEPEVFIQIGVAPVRVDVMTTIEGVEFEGAWSRRDMRPVGELLVPFICLDDLITAKLASGRRQDRRDAAALQRLRSGS